jgi:hypothetical protein
MGALDFGEIRLDGGVLTVWTGTAWVTMASLIGGGGGGAGGAGYVHDQATPASTWIVTHNLGYYPNVTVVDSGSTTVEGDITHLTINQVRIIFSAAFTGKAYLS